ncbi:M23 family metallopeptidase [Litorilituus sediminis]|uniref:M23 family metallopeptidase n=1 Tax=Litorilituus sediminis TaxID=718192 RepID=A0A4P6P916_9GAMM|nr:M23 family metallopeptidase [Litorilituus sediminis]QBG36789.1 M23 family metallopeptidase [Litorilituus sediminis]
MSLTLLYRGKNVRFSMQLKKAHWLSAVVVFALLSGLVVHLMMPMNQFESQYHASTNEIQPVPSSTGNMEQQQIAASNSLAKEQQIAALTIKFAELQSQVLRLNALGERLADDANIPEKEFNFSQLPPSGGPAISPSDVEKKSMTQLLADTLDLENQLRHEEKQLQMLESLNFGHHIENSLYLSGRPIVKGWLSSYYGMRKDPFHGRPTMHKGVDFAGKEGTGVIATGAGVVSWADKRYGYGQLIEIDHGDGYKTRYGHNKTILVKVGDVVTKGQIIAKMGSTGRSTGPHVHYEILRNNTQINPIKYVYRKAKKK